MYVRFINSLFFINLVFFNVSGGKFADESENSLLSAKFVFQVRIAIGEGLIQGVS
jgi:hypothetical protein